MPPIVKTVTLSIGHGDNHTHLLVSQLGDRPICEDRLRRISAATGLAMHELEHCTINHHLDPVSHFGRAPGMVGPFPDSHTDLHALICFAADEPPFVALRYTPIDTVFMTRLIFESLVRTHCKFIDLQFHCISN